MNLKPDEILIDNLVHTLVPGSTEWSYVQYDGPHWRDRSVFLYYKNHVVVHLLRQKHAYVCENNHQQKFRTLQEAIEIYQQYHLLRSIERWNQEKGIVGDAWCQERGTPIGTILLTLPMTTIEALQEHITTGTLSQWIVDLVQQQLHRNEVASTDSHSAGERIPFPQEMQR